jgi:hypothetical protein
MAVLAVQALGFPLFKLRSSAGSTGEPGLFRDLEQVTGHAPVAANRRQGTLALYLDDPPPASAEHGLSPWEGMSGAAVWVGDRIIGVVAEHHPSEGTGRLTARRIDRAYELLPGSDLDRLLGWLKLTPAAGQLPDVIPAEPGQFLRSAYLEQVQDIAPDALIGRDSEFAEWAEFCASSESYTWWQAGPWAGKSALASWFVTHPPAGVDIVSFFITGRLYGQADGDAFLDAMIEQLDALCPADGQSPPVPGARHGVWLSLLAGAAARAQERGRRLVVVVDGLDEDEAGASPPRGRPSIASLLPRRPPPGARFIITSRPDPGLPDDLPSGHPLRSCIVRRLLVSWVAEDVERRAKQELRDLLAGDQVAVSVVGCIAGSGGGLTRSDLSALTGAPPHKLDSALRGVFGRSLQTRGSASSRDAGADAATRVYLFAHETLRVTAEEQLGTDLPLYREKVHDWIGSYASRGWPGSTPGYAIRGYPRLLAATGDVMRLSELARDPGRHSFLLRATGSDYAALTEVRDAQRLISAQYVPDLQALVEMAVYRHAISIRNRSIPHSLPSAWARLGRLEHAEALARTITDPGDQARVLAELAAAAARAGDLDRAEALARTLTSSYARARVLAELATVASRAGDSDRASLLVADAEALARTLTSPYARAQVLAELTAAVAQAGDLDRAEALARTITDPGDQARVLAELAAAVARAGDLDRAEALASSVSDPGDRARVLIQLATLAARAGDSSRASLLAADAEALAGTIAYPGPRAWLLAELATAAARAGDSGRASLLAADAEALARGIAEAFARARLLAELATVAAGAGDSGRALLLASDAEALARTIASPRDLARALAQLAAAAAAAGDLDRAEGLARGIAEASARARVLADLAVAAAGAGDSGRALLLASDAEALVHRIIAPGDQARLLAQLATTAARVGDLDRAEGLARGIAEAGARARALADLAVAAAGAGDSGRASLLAADAEELAHTPADAEVRARVLADLAVAAAGAGDSGRASLLAADAEELARTLTNAEVQARVLADLAVAAAEARDLERARHLLALAISAETPEIRFWVGTVSGLFPSVIRNAGDVFLSVYTEGALLLYGSCSSL